MQTFVIKEEVRVFSKRDEQGNLTLCSEVIMITEVSYMYIPVTIAAQFNNIQGVPGGMDKTSGECSLC